MKWKNANRNELPSDKESVLISANGVYYVATFSGPDVHFVVENESEPLKFSPASAQIYWTIIEEENKGLDQ